MTEELAHSPLGPSSAERWLNCPGSQKLIQRFKLEESEEPDYRREGTAQHELLARCFVDDIDAWEIVGEKAANGVEITIKMADAIQEVLDAFRSRHTEGSVYRTEYRISAPDIHPDAFGTTDRVRYCAECKHLDVFDAKFGAGIMVDPEWNSQLLYYAAMLLREYPDVETLTLGICQPYGYVDPKFRIWDVTAAEVRHWEENTLKPGIHRVSDELHAGEHCRFCPVKAACPVLKGMFRAAVEASARDARTLTNEDVDLEYSCLDAVKMYCKAIEDQETVRLNGGADMKFGKLVYKKAWRVWTPHAESRLKEVLGAKIYTEPKLKSPAELEELGGKAKELVHELSYKPETGLTVAPASDKRPGVKMKSLKERFAASLEGITT